MMPLAPYTRRVEEEIAQLHGQLGSLSTRSEIAKASSYLSSCGVSADDYARHESMRTFIQSQPDAEHLWREIEIFRMMDETSKFFLDDANIDLQTLCELQWAIQTWSHMVLAGGLDLILAQHEHINMVKRRGGSPAAIFREYLFAHQAEEDFEAWDEGLMNAFRLKVFELDQGLRRPKREILLPDNRHAQASTADQPINDVAFETAAATHSSARDLELPTARDLRPSKRRKLDTVDMTDEDERHIREHPTKKEVIDFEEKLYSATPPPPDQRRSIVNPPVSALFMRSANTTPHPNNEVESLGGVSGTPHLEQNFITQPEQYLEQSVSLNIQRLQTNLADCTKRHESASESANDALGQLISAMEKPNVLDKDTTTRLKVVVEYFEEEFEDWDSHIMKDQASALRLFMDSTRTPILELLETWNAAAESFEKYVEVLAEKEKWERKVETAKLVAAAFGDS